MASDHTTKILFEASIAIEGVRELFVLSGLRIWSIVHPLVVGAGISTVTVSEFDRLPL